MSKMILVTYATRCGSTAGIAAEIATTLADLGFPTDLLPMQKVASIAPYPIVIAGSAIQGGQWLPEAFAFLRTHATDLRHKRFATFCTCMMMTIEPSATLRNALFNDFMTPVRAIAQPLTEGAFAGAFDIDNISSWIDRVGMKIHQGLTPMPQGDFRDWEAIRNWATELPTKLATL